MALTQEQRDAIELGMNDFTHAELAQKHGCSRSTIARVIAAAKASDKERAETAAAAESKEGEETKEDDGGDGQSDKAVDNFEYVPETEERSTIIELNTDDGLGKLLSSHAQLDPIADAEDATAAAVDAEDAKADDAAEDKAFEQIMNNEEGEQIGVGPSDAEMESLLHGLLGDQQEDTGGMPPPPPSRAKSSKPRKAKPKTTAAAAATRAVAAPASGNRFDGCPNAVLVTQCQLYLSHFEQVLEVITGKTPQEKERYRKAIKPNMNREELLGILSSIRGTITLTTSVNTMKSSLMCGAGLSQHVAPYIGMNLTGVAQELDAKRDEIQMACTQMVLDDWSWYEQRASGKSQLFMLCANTVFVCDAKNRQHAAMRAAESVPEEVQNKFEAL